MTCVCLSGVYPGYTQREWIEKIYPDLPEGDRPLECIQEAGEILYLVCFTLFHHNVS